MLWVGFTIPSNDAVENTDAWHEGQAGDEDRLADGMARLALLLIGSRLQRCMFMLQGYSSRSIRFLHTDPAVVKRELGAFRNGYRLHLEVAARAASVGSLRQMVDRSQFNLAPVMQLVRACESFNWDPTSVPAEFLEFLAKKHRRVLGTQIAEAISPVQF